MEDARQAGGPKPSTRVCETYRKYGTILDVCADLRSVRSETIRREGCPEWERNK